MSVKYQSDTIIVTPNRAASKLCTRPISHSTLLITEMCTVLVWMVHCEIRNRCIVGFVTWVNSYLVLHGINTIATKQHIYRVATQLSANCIIFLVVFIYVFSVIDSKHKHHWSYCSYRYFMKSYCFSFGFMLSEWIPEKIYFPVYIM